MISKAWKHFCLITHHKWVVFKLCCKVGEPWRGFVHDLSKYSPTEFRESIKYYVGTHSPITEAKNGAGATPIKTPKGWIHISHGVRNTADGLRYVLYLYATALDDPSRVIAEPGGVFLVPLGSERTGDVSNVVFCNGAIEHDGKVFIYYASSDTRMHVATTTVEKLVDYTFNTPSDPHRSPDCVKQRCELIKKNLELLK